MSTRTDLFLEPMWYLRSILRVRQVFTICASTRSKPDITKPPRIASHWPLQDDHAKHSGSCDRHSSRQRSITPSDSFQRRKVGTPAAMVPRLRKSVLAIDLLDESPFGVLVFELFETLPFTWAAAMTSQKSQTQNASFTMIYIRKYLFHHCREPRLGKFCRFAAVLRSSQSHFVGIV